jgi:hypothetical protein
MMEVDLTSCKSLNDLEAIMRIVFGRTSLKPNEFGYTEEKYNIASIVLSYFWWLNNTEQKRASALLRGKEYINAGGHDFNLFVALLFYKALEEKETRNQILKFTAINGKFVSEEIFLSWSYEKKDQCVFLLFELMFGRQMTDYLHYLIYHDGEEINLVNLPDEINQSVW